MTTTVERGVKRDWSLEVSDNEVWGIIKDGTDKLCEYGLDQWRMDKYGLGEEMRQENLARWRYIKERARELVKLAKERTP